ncbi:MAG: hypothetical protein OXC08_12705 [Thiotrichales bacterium]|nr:hypothetical protein [Thiotrichales bacterium]
MESTQGCSRVDAGPDRHVGKVTTRVWVMVLALTGLGAGALAPATAGPGGYGEWRYRSAALELDRLRCPECRRSSAAGPSARMPLDSDRAMNAPDAGGEDRLRIEADAVSATSALLSLQAGHYARLCRFRGRLCDLVAAHVLARTALIGPIPVHAPTPPHPRTPVPRRQDAGVQAPPCSMRSGGGSGFRCAASAGRQVTPFRSPELSQVAR